MNKIILASGSIGRKRLFRRDFGDAFRISVSHIDEDKIHAQNPEELVKKLAFLKAHKVAIVYKDDYVIGFDTIVLCEGKIIGKPRNKMEARDVLRSLSGKPQTVISAYAILQLEKEIKIIDIAKTELILKEMDDAFIYEYTDSHPVTRYAGGYGVQDHDGLVDILDGDMDTIIGAPMTRIRAELEKLGVIR